MRKVVLGLGVLAAAVGCGVAVNTAAAADTFPKVGDSAKDFELAAVGGEKVKLSKLTETGPVVLVVLRGYPGYQCPLCTQQVAQFFGKADAFKAAGARVVFVYPGPANDLEKRAKEFLGDKRMPDGFYLLTDPDYSFTNAYGLRWNAPAETATRPRSPSARTARFRTRW